MKVLFITFLCTISFFLCAQQKNLLKKNASISGNVFDETKSPISVHLDVIDFETKQLVQQSESNNTGHFLISAPKKSNYIIFLSKPDYLFQSVIVSLPDSGGYEKKLVDILLQKVEAEKKTILNSLSFDFYQAIVLEESRPDLERVIALMNEMPALQIEISSYTDNIGSLNFLRKLSEQRAKSVFDVLVSSGFDINRIKYKGYGPAEPIASNFTEEGRQANNRIELKVLNLDFVQKKASDLKQKKGILHGVEKHDGNSNLEQEKLDENSNSTNEEEKEDENSTSTNEEDLKDTTNIAFKQHKDSTFIDTHDTLARIDYKGKFIADKSPLAFSTVNLVNYNGEIFKSTKTDQFGTFEFLNVAADQEVTFGLDQKETKNFKKIFLADTAGVVVNELSKINDEFVLTLLPSEKIKLGKLYLTDPPLKALQKKSKKAFIIGRVIDEKEHPIKAQIEVIDNTTNQAAEKSQSDNEGRYSISVPIGKNYDITFNKSGYLFQSINVAIPESGVYEKTLADIILQKVEVGKKIVLNNIFFDSNESTLRKESFSELERAVKLMNDMASLQIEISGHTDNIGSSKNNRDLSEQRAKAVMDFLIGKGCDKNHLKYKGYGSIQPIATNNTEEGRQLNRRTEFKVLKVDLEAEQIAKAKKMKETSEATDKQGENSNSTDEKQNENLKKNNNSPIPENFKKYDQDLNGSISYEEIMTAIDSFFEDSPQGNEDKKAKESITALLDYYFEQ